MKILIIPDVHGSHNWEIAQKKIDEVDFVVFLGDLVDSWENSWPDQGENVKAIFDFKRKYPNKVKVLLGNHDFSYISGTREGSLVSGHQSGKANEIRALFTANLDIIDLAFECDGWVFSHAGFSKTWVSYMKQQFHYILDKFPDEDPNRTIFSSMEEYCDYQKKVERTALVWDENEWGVDKLNEVWHTLTHFSGDKNFIYGFDELLDWHGCFSGSGDEVTQGPLWIRPNSLISEPYYPKQVVGHTEYCFMGNYEALTNKNTDVVILCDSASHIVPDVFDTQNPPASSTIADFNRKYKQFDKKIGNLKSIFGGLGADYKEFERVEKIKEVFPDNFDYIYDTYFKEWNV
jgi:hypothetical protein